MPGKADVKKKTIREYQKADKNTDRLYGNLNMKFIAECPTIKFLRATFCRMRPNHILTTSFISRSTRLCTKHQNMTLLLKQTANPETFAMERIAEEMLRNKLSNHVVFSQWTKIQINEQEQKKLLPVSQKVKKRKRNSSNTL